MNNEKEILVVGDEGMAIDEIVSDFYDDKASEEEFKASPKETPKITPAILSARKNAAKLLKQLKKNKYFHLDNAETAIINVLNSSMGRKGRRNLSKQLGVNWSQYLEMETVVIETMPSTLSRAAKASIMERYNRLFTENKITASRFNKLTTSLMLNKPIDYDE